ncbi:MAG TPA: alpha/beta hydrolase [Leptolyngbyaceae cyanobacterium M65_K2018_010]|nr:alpha/beta hydrolase [Leptolyngbyaceae cyanobacterium M65_K2018_010]
MTAPNRWQHDVLAANGIRLHYVIQGQGPLMLFLHGFPEFWYAWRHQIAEFASDYTCVALDLRGYNESDKPLGVEAYRLEVLIEDVVGAIQALGFERCTLVGHDWGGAIAWAVAYAYPQRLDALVTLNIPHPARFAAGLRTPQQLLRSWYIGLFQIPVLPELLLRVNDYWWIEPLFRGLAIRKTAFSDADLHAYKAAAAKPGALRAMVNYYRALRRGDWLTRPWSVLTVPTLLIWGEEDVALGKELALGTEAYVGDFQLRYIPQCSHWVQQEQPEQVNHYIREFLALKQGLPRTIAP